MVVEHPGSLLSFHVEARSGAYVLRDRLVPLAPTAPLWFVLRGPADDGLVLLVAWDTVVKARQPGLYHSPRLHEYLAPRGTREAGDVAEKVAAGARATGFMS